MVEKKKAAGSEASAGDPGSGRIPGPGREPGEVALLFAMVYRAMTDHMHDLLHDHGREPLRPAHGYVFRYLQSKGPVTIVELAAQLDVTKQAASKTVAELVDWGYIERHVHPTDGRAQVLALTQRGKDYVRLADRLWGEVEDHWAGLIGDERLAAVRDDLQAYLDSRYGDDRVKLRPVW
ncbi:MarR family winged helix-turn-helix transcriptional regulator [Kibdelosporangium philippinense]|uniref:MarR family winged helix-turn-helix transcriptional regulator n=1 Tax=Kibdelosporangium philippinense TaxID=211113 RepID=A0ABS9A039_9PSEU|nr:MarR family winged helix-turn-helix transcriptional regulator [Kibdelosporangium philippinense]MCE7012117.1 MarR family winged helix-turn-helix transcriptional regulator [Kibdelosporangium philippinense]